MLHFGIRDQNLELKIGISDEKIYLVTTLIKLKVQDTTPSSTYLDDFTNEVRLVR